MHVICSGCGRGTEACWCEEEPVRWSDLAKRAPTRVLLCLDRGCEGEFYLPLDTDEQAVCPNDRSHPVAVYSGPVINTGGTVASA